jgi:hypothetical protein
MRKAQRGMVAMMVRTTMTDEQVANAVNPSVTVAEVAAMRAEHTAAEEAFQNSPEQQARRKTAAMIEFYGRAVQANGGNYEAATAATVAEFGA